MLTPNLFCVPLLFRRGEISLLGHQGRASRCESGLSPLPTRFPLPSQRCAGANFLK